MRGPFACGAINTENKAIFELFVQDTNEEGHKIPIIISEASIESSLEINGRINRILGQSMNDTDANRTIMNPQRA
ncbi:hypothetical protein EVAR_33753_1 [Eumeta japonica]|uniref:Uncharacterized protein n=1 Tax=Eumeta variegata TaxID=151549 RepID=A0A4C1VTV0_EUMVA|nr:hypothetical protein EVAR_33753_1 [Eumeta japonica]